MGDNVTLNAGSGGATIAADDIGGGVLVQRTKTGWGPDGSFNDVDDAVGKRLPVDIGHDGVTTLQASQVSGVANTTTSRTTTTGLGKFTDIQILINVTGAGVATGVLNLFLEDSADGGTTWDDLVAAVAVTFGAGTQTQMFHISGKSVTSKAQGSAAAAETLAAGSVRQGPFGDRIRVREKVSGVSGSPTGVTYTITAIFKR